MVVGVASAVEIREVMKLRRDEIVPAGTLRRGAKAIVDRRTWE
jgi:hypothetical protein